MDHGFRNDAYSWVVRDPFVYSCIYRNDLFKTPVSTPRKLRRSISHGDVTINQSPRLKPEDIADDQSPESLEEEMIRLRARVVELEQQLNDAMEKLLMSEDSVVVHSGDKETETALRTSLEQLEAELETCKVELRLRDEDLERSEKLAEELDTLKVCLALCHEWIHFFILFCFSSNVTTHTLSEAKMNY